MEVQTKISHTFEVDLKWNIEQKNGTVHSPNKEPFTFGAPPEFNGTDTVWSPEHLLAVSLSSCYVTTFMYFSRLLKIDVRDLKVHAHVEVEKEGAAMFEAKRFILHPVIEFSGNPDVKTVDNLLSKAKRYCIISNSVKGEIVVEPSIKLS